MMNVKCYKSSNQKYFILQYTFRVILLVINILRRTSDEFHLSLQMQNS